MTRYASTADPKFSFLNSYLKKVCAEEGLPDATITFGKQTEYPIFRKLWKRAFRFLLSRGLIPHALLTAVTVEPDDYTGGYYVLTVRVDRGGKRYAQQFAYTDLFMATTQIVDVLTESTRELARNIVRKLKEDGA